MTNQPFHIAIDGPVAAGKGTVSRLVADRLAFLYVDTGAMYRVTAWMSIHADIDLTDEAAVSALIEKTNIEMYNPKGDERDGRLTTVKVNGEDVSWQIRTEEIGRGASKVAVHPLVRKALVAKQQNIAKNQNIVMEGRDTTYAVLPDAQLKIYLTASDTVRAKRRHMQLLTKGTDVEFAQVYKDLLERDELDTNRKTDPLKIVPEAWVIDTSDLSIERVVEMIVAKVQVLLESSKKS
ncbi:MAG: (d)CMP kinase [Patescibacteria group bacterium]